MYVDCLYDRETDKIHVVERVNGVRILKEDYAHHIFYWLDPNGTYKTIFNDRCRRFNDKSIKKFRMELKKKRDEGKHIFESDIHPVFRYLEENYTNGDLPVLNLCLFDIEAAYDAVRGHAPPTDPFNAVTAISFHLSHENKLYTFALLPETLTEEEGRNITAEFPDTYLFTDEKELLRTFLEVIYDVDVFSGWNSDYYDVPYLVNRIKMLLGEEETKKFCLWDKTPRPREYKSKFGRLINTYEFVGRIHLDYQLLYQKHNVKAQHSFALDAIGRDEVGESKVPYPGNLDDLYKKDFFKFIEYSRQDVNILVKLDKKLKFIELSNKVAHNNTVLLKTTMGSVTLVEQAIINAMHKRGKVVPDKKSKGEELLEQVMEEDDKSPVVGAYVAHPKTGKHYYIGCVDINSLYPSAIRALNMSPETIVGQVRQTETLAYVQQRVDSGIKSADAWEGIFQILELDHMHAEDDTEIVVDFEDGRVMTTTGKGLYEYIFNPENNVCISANGTIFRTDIDGIIPSLLGDWYAERKAMQAKMKEIDFLINGLEIDETLSDKLQKLL